MNSVDIIILSNMVISSMVFVILHLALFRFIGDNVFRGIFYVYILGAVAGLIGLSFSSGEVMSGSLWVWTAFASLALYSLWSVIFILYVFGPSETSIRVRILREILAVDPDGLNQEEIFERYNSRGIIGRRLDRLIRANYLSVDGENYRINKRPLFYFLNDFLARIYGQKTSSNNFRILSLFKKFVFLKFFPPFLLWIFLFRDFFTKRALIIDDAFSIYACVKYYIDNLVFGIFPSWNPYTLWGMATLRQIGEFNPLWFLIPILHGLGMEYYLAFIFTLVITFFIGIWGFYLLVKRILNDQICAYWAMLLLMFSSFGMTFFDQTSMLMFMVPSVWFAYFLLRFIQEKEASAFLFMSFFVAQTITTYIPFYFVTAVMLAGLCFAVIYFKQMVVVIKDIWLFMRSHFWLTFFCGFLVALAGLSQLLTWFSLKEYFIPMMRSSELTFADIKNSGVPVADFLRNFSPFGLFLAAAGESIIKHSSIFFNLKVGDFQNQRFFYIPIMAHVMFYVSILLFGNKKRAFFLLLTFMLFLIILVDLTPVYGFLFEHLIFFKMFRNLFLMLAFLIIGYACFVSAQLQNIFQIIINRQRWKWFLLPAILLIHIFLLLWMFRSSDVLVSSYVTVILSAIFFIVYCWKGFSNRHWLIVLVLSVITLLQPIEVIQNYMVSARETRQDLILTASKTPLVSPRFQYTRPLWNKHYFGSLKENDQYRVFWSYLINQKDSPGFISHSMGYATRWTYHIFQKFNRSDFSDYVHYKFILYDQAVPVKDETLDVSKFTQDIKALRNRAYIFLDDENISFQNELMPEGAIPEQAEALRGENEHFSVQHFDVNNVEVHMFSKTPRFLVFNDSYHPRWQVTVNGKEQKLWRTNLAFKGVWVPEGDSIVRFQYCTLGGQWFPFLTLIFFMVFFMVCWLQFQREQKIKRLL